MVRARGAERQRECKSTHNGLKLFFFFKLSQRSWFWKKKKNSKYLSNKTVEKKKQNPIVAYAMNVECCLWHVCLSINSILLTKHVAFVWQFVVKINLPKHFAKNDFHFKVNCDLNIECYEDWFQLKSLQWLNYQQSLSSLSECLVAGDWRFWAMQRYSMLQTEARLSS